MNTYKVHNVYILTISIFLVMIGYTSTRLLIDPNYIIFGIRYLPRAVLFYIALYLWYRFLNTAYKIEINYDGHLRIHSLIKKQSINVNEIIKIKDGIGFIDIITDKRSISVSTLIDGIANVIQKFYSIIPKTTKGDTVDSNITVLYKPTSMSRKILKIIIVLLLIAFAAYIELEYIAL